MYTIEEINIKVSEANYPEEKAVLTAHLLARLFQKEDSEKYSKERFIEALTFTMCFIYQLYSDEKDEQKLFIIPASVEIEKCALKLDLDFGDTDALHFF